MQTDAVDIARPAEPGRREGHRRARPGLRGAPALLCAISDALGGHYFNRDARDARHDRQRGAPGRPQSHKPLQVNTA